MARAVARARLETRGRRARAMVTRDEIVRAFGRIARGSRRDASPNRGAEKGHRLTRAARRARRRREEGNVPWRLIETTL
tara:strand:+ start:3969 stop:4205 length:237 start_codon:yes stop_codon:yes gene_type:complete